MIIAARNYEKTRKILSFYIIIIITREKFYKIKELYFKIYTDTISYKKLLLNSSHENFAFYNCFTVYSGLLK